MTSQQCRKQAMGTLIWFLLSRDKKEVEIRICRDEGKGNGEKRLGDT